MDKKKFIFYFANDLKMFFFIKIKLVAGLGDEKGRWAENVKHLDYLISNVIGDVLAASGFIAYLGPFTV